LQVTKDKVNILKVIIYKTLNIIQMSNKKLKIN